MRLFHRLTAAAVIFGILNPGLVSASVVATPQVFIEQQQFNRLIEDGDFLNRQSMSVADIQNFLVSHNSYLAVAPPSELGEDNNGRSAAQIIWDAAQARRMNTNLQGVPINETTGTVSPRVILITLQKEQSLVTIPPPAPGDQNAMNSLRNRLRAAMGYGCPDAGGCDPRWLGFTRQVEGGAWQLRFNYEIAGFDAAWWTRHYGAGHQFRVGNGRSMSYNFAAPPMSGIVTVTYLNRATASLYRYTPHITYGNFNFWRLSRLWFGMSLGSGAGGGTFNDLSPVSLRTYGTQVVIQGSKDISSRVFFNNQLIADLGSSSWRHTFTPNIGRHNYRFEFRDANGGLIGAKNAEIDRRRPGDIDGSLRVDLADLSLLSNGWGTVVRGEDWRNLNPEVDNEINLLDLSIFANNWEG